MRRLAVLGILTLAALSVPAVLAANMAIAGVGTGQFTVWDGTKYVSCPVALRLDYVEVAGTFNVELEAHTDATAGACKRLYHQMWNLPATQVTVPPATVSQTGPNEYTVIHLEPRGAHTWRTELVMALDGDEVGVRYTYGAVGYGFNRIVEGTLTGTAVR